MAAIAIMATASVVKATPPEDRDIVMEAEPSTHRLVHAGVSPNAALAIGAASTIVPIALAVAGQGNALTWAGIITGVIAGPACGLASGGRSDLALRGALIRTGGLGLLALGGATFGASFETDTGAEGRALIVLGVAGGIVTVGSMIWDLAITHHATQEAREGRVSFGVRPDGCAVVSVRF